MSTNSVCNDTLDLQIGLPLRSRPILIIERLSMTFTANGEMKFPFRQTVWVVANAV